MGDTGNWRWRLSDETFDDRQFWLISGNHNDAGEADFGMLLRKESKIIVNRYCFLPYENQSQRIGVSGLKIFDGA